jgi:dTDP-4-amino-4,6-dideoxygalactose transaminase
VILVHYYGRVLPGAERLAAVCRERGVVVIEDCALALGARVDGTPAGRSGDVAVFSFTKSDWCYGGGMVATPNGEWGQRLRAMRDEGCHPAARLAFFYGLLRRADVAANHPGLSRSAGGAGRWLEEGLAWLEPSLAGNFFDAGRFDARMPEFAARRALHILRDIDAASARRRAMLPRLYAALRAQIRGAAERLKLFPGRESLEAGDSGSFLLLCAGDGDAAGWAERADAAGCTLRLSWPAYQHDDAAHRGEAAAWLGRHLLIVENPA